MARELPTAFCWSKMGDEAGQPLAGILARKDAERALSGGVFYWGIGASLGQSIWSFVEETECPQILFSPMRSKAKAIDANPDRVFAWTAYLDRSGKKRFLPEQALVTSRGTMGDKVKKHHYALVCERANDFKTDFDCSLRWSELRNYNSGSKLGYSQVTAIVRRGKPRPQCHSYSIRFSARLVAPFFVTLVDPVEIPRQLWKQVSSLWASGGFTKSKWGKWLEIHRPHFQRVTGT